MSLIISIVIMISVTISTIMDVKRIKSNKELMKKYDEALVSRKKLCDKLDSKSKLDKETYEKIESVRENFGILKDNLTLDYDHLTEEVIKRINEKQKIGSKTLINV